MTDHLTHHRSALDEVCNVDVEVRLPDGSRWSATIFTVAEVERLTARWSSTGKVLNGRYFRCSDCLIVKESGVTRPLPARSRCRFHWRRALAGPRSGV
jgi:hypothetical protein